MSWPLHTNSTTASASEVATLTAMEICSVYTALNLSHNNELNARLLQVLSFGLTTVTENVCKQRNVSVAVNGSGFYDIDMLHLVEELSILWPAVARSLTDFVLVTLASHTLICWLAATSLNV